MNINLELLVAAAASTVVLHAVFSLLAQVAKNKRITRKLGEIQVISRKTARETDPQTLHDAVVRVDRLVQDMDKLLGPQASLELRKANGQIKTVNLRITDLESAQRFVEDLREVQIDESTHKPAVGARQAVR